MNEGDIWIKKESESFDVAMGSNDSAEISDLCGLYLLSLLSPLKINSGLYRDDGLIASKLTPRQNENLKKKICKIFKDEGLRITIEANIKVVNFLDVTFDISKDIFKPFMKPNDTPIYINKESNHPPSILKNIPQAVNDRLSRISANEKLFEEAAPPYQRALNDSGFNHTLKFNPPINRGPKKRSRKIIWYNPPFSINVKTNVGQKFLKIIDECFPKGHPLHKIFNRNTVKMSYKCMPNMARSIAGHNSRFLQQQSVTPPAKCNCQKGIQHCPVEGRCLTTGVVYKATVTSQTGCEYYTGLTSRSFKVRRKEHNSDFNNRNRKGTHLSTYIWALKDRGEAYSVKWDITDRAPPFNPTSKKCRLCLKEKWNIMFKPKAATLNVRSEIFSTCRHRLAEVLANYE